MVTSAPEGRKFEARVRWRRRRAFWWIGGALIVAILFIDRFAGRVFLPDEFARRSMSEIRPSMRQRSLWRPRGPDDLPPPKRADEVVVGIFGGSVAKGLAASLQARVPAAAIDYSKAVGKQLRIADFAMGGGREPQQFNVLHMFHDAMDVAVFVDGFNEMMEEPESCDRLVPFWTANRDSSPIEILKPLIRLNERIAAVADLPIWEPLNGSWLFKIYLSHLNNRSFWRTENFARSMGVPSDDGPPPTGAQSDAASSWARCVELSAGYAASVDLPIFFFLQPNQYVAGSKPFSEEEKAHAFRHPGRLEVMLARLAGRPTLGDIDNRYTEFERHIDALRLRGFRVYSLANVYRDVTETVYSDDYCHVNQRGNEIMAQAIFLKLFEEHGAPTSPPHPSGQSGT